MTQHEAPLPWQLHPARTLAHVWSSKSHDAYTNYIGLSLPYKTPIERRRANFIIQACNSHEDAKNFAERFNQIAGSTTAKGATAKPTMAELNELLELARTFLAKAKSAVPHA